MQLPKSKILRSYFLILIACIPFAFSSKAQNTKNKPQKIDSLLAMLNSPLPDTNLVMLQVQLSQEYRYSKIDSSHFYADLATELSNKMKNKHCLIAALDAKGLAFVSESKYKEALACFERMKPIALTTDKQYKLGDYFNHSGICFDRMGNKTKALEMYLEGARLFEKEKNYRAACAAYNNISAIYRKQLNDSKSAFLYAHKSISILENIQDHSLYVLKGTAYERASTAMLLEKNYDSALHYANKSLDAFLASNSKLHLISQYANVANIYSRTNRQDTAAYYVDKAIKIGRETTYRTWLAHALNISGDIYRKRKMFNESLAAYSEAITIGKEVNESGRLIASYEGIIDLFVRFDDYKNAYLYRDSLSALQDSINSTDVTNNLNELNLKFETEKKENEIQKLSADKKIQQLQLEKQQAEIAGNLLAAKQKQIEIDLLQQAALLKDMQLKRQNDEIKERTLQALFNEQKLRLTEQEKTIKEKKLQNETIIRNSLIGLIILSGVISFVVFNRFQLKKKLEKQTALNNERLRIASELHDEVGSDLSGISVYSNVVKMQYHKDKQLAEQTLTKIADHAQITMQTMQDIVWAINPTNDSIGALIKQMKVFATPLLEARDIQFDFKLSEGLQKQSLNMEQRQHLYLIFKEAINNMIKYASASVCHVEISKYKNEWKLSVADNGSGFTKIANETTRDGNGIENMKKRAAALNGVIEIESEPGKGTRIEIKFLAAK